MKMKTDEETGAIICTKCGKKIILRGVSRVQGFPVKAKFRCPTKKTNVSGQEIPCSGGFIPLMKRKQILKLPEKTKKYYKLTKRK